MKVIIALIIFFISVCFNANADITLRWTANTELDLAGYKIYYRSDPTVSYTVATLPEDELDQGPSPIIITILDENDPNYMSNINPEFTLTGFDDLTSNKDYWLVVTAYDNEEPKNESGFSNEVTTVDGNTNADITVTGGGSGGGCFINTLRK